MAKTGSKRIAERYVKALFDVASKDGILAAVEADLKSLGNALAESKDLREFIANPLLGRDQQVAALTAILGSIKAQKLTVDFVTNLVAQKRLGVLSDIVTIFAQWAEKSRGELTAEVVSAAPLADADIAALKEKLGKAYGKKINLQLKQDASLLGGMVVKIGSIQLDSSLAGKLDRLQLALKAA